jgi:hypothetical protein
MQITDRLWAVHLGSGATVYACSQHLDGAMDEYALDDTPVSRAIVADDDFTICQWC